MAADKNEQDDALFREMHSKTGIRKRPAMYIGGTDFFGFIQYLVSAFDISLDNGATWIDVEVSDRFSLASDANVSVRLNKYGELEPFEAFGELKPRHVPDATIITALSREIQATIRDGTTLTRLVCECGERKSLEQLRYPSAQPQMHFEFSPDDSIFTVTEVSPAVLHSYCRRTACLYPGVLFRVTTGDHVAQYKLEHGIRDFFTAIATPYQVLHEPIHVRETDGELTVELVFVFQSWSENRIWSFVNRGRVPDGGTHETGMLNAIAQFYNSLQHESPVGVLAVLAIEYPHVTYEGCIKSRIGNPELRERVAALVTMGLTRWAEKKDKELEYLKSIERFQFADAW